MGATQSPDWLHETVEQTATSEPTPTPIVQPPLLRQMFPATKAARQFSAWQVAPWCEALIAMLNRKMPARFTLTKDGDWALDIHVEINPPALPAAEEPDSERDA